VRNSIRFGREGGQQQLVPAPVLVLDQRPHHRMDTPQLLARRQAVHAVFRDARFHLLDQTGHADLEELVEIGGDDREELHRSSSGCRLFCACSSTRRLNASQESSRLK
jgi:predicted nucleic acid-binding OB-fold protein